MIVQVPDEFVAHIDAAVVRLSYLFPEHTFNVHDSAIEVRADGAPVTEPSVLRKEVHFQLYRQKIYSDTLSIRKWLYSDE